MKDSSVNISIELEGLDVDSLSIIYYDNGLFDYTSNLIPYHEIVSHKSANGKYNFKIHSLDHLVYFSLTKGIYNESFGAFDDLLTMYLLEPGDNVDIKIQRYNTPKLDTQKIYSFRFLGKGSEKFRCRYFLDSIRSNCELGVAFPSGGHYVNNNDIDKKIKYSLAFLKKNKRLLSDSSFQVITADYIGQYEKLKYRLYNSFYFKAKISEDSINELKQIKILRDDLINRRIATVPKWAQSISNQYLSFVLARDLLAYRRGFSKDDQNYDSSFYNNVLKHYDSRVLEKSIAIFLIGSEGISMLHKQDMILDAANIVKDKYLNLLLVNLRNISKGQLAYAFSLQDINGKNVSLNDFRGKVVFVDFWFTGCTACRSYYKSQLSPIEDKYHGDSGVVFITISLDKKYEVWRKSLISGAYTSDHCVNLYTNGEGSFHPIIKYYNVSGCPQPLIIDRHGRMFEFNYTLRRKETLDKCIQAALNTM